MLTLAEVRRHVNEAAGKLSDLGNLHLPAIAHWLESVEANPLVTAVESAAGGPLAADAVALLNGITGMIGAVQQSLPPSGETAPGAGTQPGTEVTPS